ncbi:MAG: hypothetical protein IJ650_05110 [Paludibacteraceae bacterium]|nr:hypothetical protein [Paludibacteraceae bacterium]
MYKIKYSKEEVSAVIDKLAESVVLKENTVFLVLMNGGAWFAHELISRFGNTPVREEYAKVSSYAGQTRGSLKVTYLPEIDWEGKEIIVLDDICDSGNTLNNIHAWLQTKNPADVRFITLLARKGRYTLDEGVKLTAGILDESEDFFVGCGLDDNSMARNLPYVGVC